MITSELKDRILNDLINTGINLEVNLHDAPADYQIPLEYLSVILDQFQNLNFLHQEKMLGGHVYVYLTADAFDFMHKGGFTAKEAIEKAALEKLSLELESLKKDFPEKTEFLSSVLANIATVAGLFLPS
ncbi:MAG: hypothetical protein ABS44_11640 [Chryseobacterium sp. SCN 40-13]|nr:MAG: hypothetical protein ABS44_11640 [Chryseobacterium sp. SCN 40-13]